MGSGGPRNTCRPSKGEERRARRATGTRWAACCTRRSPAGCHSQERRPGAEEILSRLSVALPAPGTVATGPSPASALLIGRDAQLAELERAFGLAQSGRAVLTIVRGPSGIGKTALVRRFVEQLAADDRAVVLSGRCYVRESMQ